MQIFLSEIEQQYLLELKEFYSPYFPTLEEVDIFINKAIQLDWDDRKPRQMLFQVQRFVSLATEIDKIRPERDGLRMLFLKCCMESLAKLSNKKPTEFYECFATFFSEEGKHYILDNLSLSFIEHQKNGLTIHEGGNLNIADILSIIKAMRDMVVHEGNYWELQLFAHDKDSAWLTHIETNEQLLSQATYRNTSKQIVTYHFETTLQYEKFIYFFVEACKNYIANYIEIKLNPKNL
ncbi:MAG: hypothetical protein IJW40_10440 [Clostridia bacterium]|nr:hypothetical protein [Clostridia bacterium]